MFSVLELGVDGVIFSTDSEKEVEELRNYLETLCFQMNPRRF